jgi:ankyrin repeat protein
MHNNVEMVNALLGAGADPAIKNDEGQTAADMAANAGATDVVELFRVR